MKNEKRKLKLPECGIFVGTGIYPSSADYLLSTLYAHMAWQPQTDLPLEMIDKIINDNQGNLAQVWGIPRGNSPQVVAEWIYALDEIGIDVPPPNWETGENVKVSECRELAEHADRKGAGLFRFAREAMKRGLYTTFIYTQAEPEWSHQLAGLGDWYLGYDFGERFSFGLRGVEIDPDEVTLKVLADCLVGRVREHTNEYREGGWGNIMATSSNFFIDYEVLGGVDIPLIEDFAFSHLNMASALSRGLYRQHNLPAWGSHLAHEHYAWLPNASEYRSFLYKAALYQKYMCGAKIIINESGNWFVEASLCEDSPKHKFPEVPIPHDEVDWLGEKGADFTPYIEDARKHYHTINYDSEICRSYRKETSDFYDFVKENGTPEGQPESTVAVIKGNYDLCSHRFNANRAVGGAGRLSETNPMWLEGAPERGWGTVKKAFYPLHPVTGEYVNRALSGSPYGNVDIVSFAGDEIDTETLSANYKAMLFSGWNTCSEKQYEVLKEYVLNGGTLFVSIPHLSTNLKRNYTRYSIDELINGGDFSDLCGIKVKGKGMYLHWATAPKGNSELGFSFPRRFGILGTPMGDIEVTDPNAEVLVVDDEAASPLLLRTRKGKGMVYFLNSWFYPGALDIDEGPGSIVDSPNLIGYIYRHIANTHRGCVWITSDGEKVGKECEYVSFSYFPESDQICLFNIDLNKTHEIVLHYHGQQQQIVLEGGEFRVIDMVDGQEEQGSDIRNEEEANVCI